MRSRFLDRIVQYSHMSFRLLAHIARHESPRGTQHRMHTFVHIDPLGFPDRTNIMIYTDLAGIVGSAMAAAIVGAGFKPAQTYDMRDTHLDPRLATENRNPSGN